MRVVVVLALATTFGCGRQPEGACRFAIAVRCDQPVLETTLCIASDDEGQCDSFARTLRESTCGPPADASVAFEPEGTCPDTCESDDDCDEGCCLAPPQGQCVALEMCDAICPPGSSPVGDPPICECDAGLQWSPDASECVAP